MLCRSLAQERIGKVDDDAPVKARVLDVDAGCAVPEADQRKCLVEPPVSAVAVQQLLAGLQRALGRRFLQAQAKQGRLYDVEHSRVAGMMAAQGVPADRPV